MNGHCTGSTSILVIFLLILTACTLSGCSKSPAKPAKIPPPRQVQLSPPTRLVPENLSPGLAVIYLDKFYRTIAQMPDLSKAKKQGRKGEPILQFNHQFGKDGLVFGSGEKTGVGIMLTGYLHLNTPGEYRFQAMANDGIEFTLHEKLVFDDPAVHKDRLSPAGIVDVPAGGWYPLSIRYFQRKGTATLKLYWQPPGADNFSIMPKKIYAH